MRRPMHTLISILLALSTVLSFLVIMGCQPEASPPSSEPETTSPVGPSEPTPAPPASPPEIQGEITLLSSTAEVEYPSSLTFTVEAESPAEITDVELNYKIGKITTVALTTRITPDFEPAQRVKTSSKLEMKKLGGLPPGAEVMYHWEIEDAEGRRLETEPDAVTFNDLRYPWTSLAQGEVTLYWYQGSQAFAQELMDAAQAALAMLATDAGAQLQRPVKIYIYATYDDLRGAMIYPQEWTGGVAFTEFGIVAIGISPDNLEWGRRTIAHELAHLVTYQMTYNPYGEIPTWLNEGLSMYAEGGLTPQEKAILNDAIRKDELVSVHSLSSSFPARGEITLHYVESYSLVKFLIDTYGNEKMLHLLATFKQGNSYDDALLEVYGFDTDGLEDAWRISLGLKPLAVSKEPHSLFVTLPLS
jgi:hypothetical protein